MNNREDLEQLVKALRAFPENIHRNVINGAVRASAYPILRRAKELVPVKSGLLKKSIKLKKRAKRYDKKPYEVKYFVGAGGNVKSFKTSAYHAHLVEFGTSTAPPKPFMRPAFEQEGKGSIERFKAYLAKRVPKEIEKAKK